MGTYLELQVLKQEEKTLLKLQTKLSDQLNRLKVEELALLSQIRAGQVEETISEETKQEEIVEKHEIEEIPVNEDVNEEPLYNLGPSAQYQEGVEEMEEDEEDDDSQNELHSAQDQLTLFMKHLEHQTKS